MSSQTDKAVFKPEAIAVVATDVDLTLYPADKAYFNACVQAVKLLDLGLKGYFNKQALKGVAEKHGLHKGREVPEKLSNLAEDARRKIDSDFIAQNPPLVAAFRQLTASDEHDPIQVFAMSHSDSHWVSRVLAQVGFSKNDMPRERFLTPDTCFGLSKRSPETYKKLFSRAQGHQPQQFVLIDDSLSNLRAAHEAGLQTVWIAVAGASALEKPDYVGLAVTNPIEALNKINAARTKRFAPSALCA